VSRLFEAFFTEASTGQRFCLFYPPDNGRTVLGAIVYVHPFAEELNRSRRMAALQARAFAAAGYAVLQIDLHGCGDSSGEFGDATWDAWIDDVIAACAWLRDRIDLPVWIWGLRAGCLIAAEAAFQIEKVAGLVFWQPVFSGRQCLQQFLRLKIAGDMLNGGMGTNVERLHQQLTRGESIEIAGYLLSSELAAGLGKAELTVPTHVGRIECLEVLAKPNPSLSPVLATRLAEWRSAGQHAHGTAVSAPAFWQTAEITESQALVEATLSAIKDCSP
jgi:exosortase A-associated hydrolase 2